MSGLDLALIIILLALVAWGFLRGLIYSLGTIIGIVAGAYLATLWYVGFGQWLTAIFLGNGSAASLVAFILIFLAVNQLVGLVAWFLAKVFDLVAIIPGLKLINRVGGAVLGFVVGLFITGVILIAAMSILGNQPLTTAINNSFMADFVMTSARWLPGLLHG